MKNINVINGSIRTVSAIAVLFAIVLSVANADSYNRGPKIRFSSDNSSAVKSNAQSDEATTNTSAKTRDVFTRGPKIRFASDIRGAVKSNARSHESTAGTRALGGRGPRIRFASDIRNTVKNSVARDAAGLEKKETDGKG